jgi:hypothetical protein
MAEGGRTKPGVQRKVARFSAATCSSVGAAGQAAPARPRVPEYPGALTSIDALDSQAAGWGLISAESSRGVIRRMPTVASIDGTLLPSLAVEMLRVAQQAPSLRLAVSQREVRSVTVGRLTVPTEADGAVRVYFSPHLAQRFVSAVDVLDGKVRESELRGQLVPSGNVAPNAPAITAPMDGSTVVIAGAPDSKRCVSRLYGRNRPVGAFGSAIGGRLSFSRRGRRRPLRAAGSECRYRCKQQGKTDHDVSPGTRRKLSVSEAIARVANVAQHV